MALYLRFFDSAELVANCLAYRVCANTARAKKVAQAPVKNPTESSPRTTVRPPITTGATTLQKPSIVALMVSAAAVCSVGNACESDALSAVASSQKIARLINKKFNGGHSRWTSGERQIRL